MFDYKLDIGYHLGKCISNTKQYTLPSNLGHTQMYIGSQCKMFFFMNM